MFDITYTSFSEETPTEPAEESPTHSEEGETGEEGRSTSTGRTTSHMSNPALYTTINDDDYSSHGQEQPISAHDRIAGDWVTGVLVMIAIIVSLIVNRNKKED